MTRTRTHLLAAALSLLAVPALAGGVSFDLPRLDFPPSDDGATRNCQTVTQPECAKGDG